MTQHSLARSLGFKESAALVVGTVIGTGVFLKAATMSQQLGSAFWVLAAWVAAGLLSFVGALCYSELGSRYPHAGGEYVYLREAYGRLFGFLFGWMRFWIGTPGSIAAYAVGAATFLGAVLPLGSGHVRTTTALGLIALFSGLNCFSVAFGGRLQSFLTFLKIAMIAGLTVAIFSMGEGQALTGSAENGSFVGEFPGWSLFGAAMLAALWAYDGWNNMPMAAGEVKDPGRNVPRALVLGMFIIFVLYIGVNASYFFALPISEVAASNSRLHPEALPIATRAAEIVFGPVAVGLLSIAFVISAVGAMNGSILTGARIPYAMARDGLFFSRLGSVNKSNHTPVAAVLIQGLVAGVLAMSGSFDQLTDYVVFAGWIFYALVTASLFVFRKRGEFSGFKTPLYPWLPIVFLVCSVLLLINTVVTSPKESGIGLAFILAGIPAYFLFRKFETKQGIYDNSKNST